MIAVGSDGAQPEASLALSDSPELPDPLPLPLPLPLPEASLPASGALAAGVELKQPWDAKPAQPAERKASKPKSTLDFFTSHLCGIVSRSGCPQLTHRGAARSRR